MTMPVRQPATVALAMAIEVGKKKVVLFAVGERGERLHQGAERRGFVGAIPARRKHVAGACIDQDVFDLGLREATLQKQSSRLMTQRRLSKTTDRAADQ